MSFRSIFSSHRIRLAFVFVLFFITAFLFAADRVQQTNWLFVLALLALAILTLVSLETSFNERAAEKTQTEEQKQELARIKDLLEQQDRTGRLLVRRDLELTRANDHLRVLDQMKTDFVSVATHQLRTPLSAIRWTISMLLNGDLGALTDKQRTFLMKAYESNNRMVTLINDMLFADHLESGKIQATFHLTTSLPDLLDNLLLELYPMAEKKKVRIVFQHPDPSYPPARIDSPNMRAIMQNLVENAIKYTPENGSVTITLSRDPSGAVVFSVADTGIGIPAAEQSRIFTRFYRAANAQKRETDGSGLGLFISQAIVKKYQGEIWFESLEGTGTIFHVKLPIAPDTTPTPVATATPAPEATPQPINKGT